MNVPTVPEFLDGGRALLAAHYPSRADQRQDRFEWGQGSDAVGLFPVADEHDRLDQLEAAKRHRALLFDAGYGWIAGPPEYGGRGLPRSYERAFASVLREFQVPDEGVFTIGLGMVAPTILAHGQEAAKEHYLPRLWRGDLVGCQLFSEPSAGSDLASVATSAERRDDGWRATGQKVWTSEAHLSDIGLLLARTAPGPRYRNLTAFVVDMHTAGVEVRPLRQMTGGAAFNEVFLDDVAMPDPDRLGEVGAGWEVARTTLRSERSSLGAMGLGSRGIMSTERLKALVRELGKADDPMVRQRAAQALIQQRTSRYTRARFDALTAAGRPPGAEAAILKLQLSANFTALAELAAGILGPRITADTGEWGTYAWTELLLSAPGYRIGGGTDEIIKNMLAERALGLPAESRDG